ncbi:MAG: hypothetical protein HY908_11955 [Myxococcales bacterium]|nr:hypothetical protein [Myxococcales bacterium]
MGRGTPRTRWQVRLVGRVVGCALVAGALVGCSAREVTATADSARTSTPPSRTTPAGASPTGAAAARGFTVVEVTPAAGELARVLGDHLAKAKALGQKPYAELWAEWCEPCVALRRSLGDPRMVKAFRGTYIVQLDVDAWGTKLDAAQLPADAIPVFYELADDGRPTGRKIDGGAWGDNTPANMAPPLDRFFHPG